MSLLRACNRQKPDSSVAAPGVGATVRSGASRVRRRNFRVPDLSRFQAAGNSGWPCGFAGSGASSN
eukprot:5289588-Alexandrium_andersonii.AAC.1